MRSSVPPSRRDWSGSLRVLGFLVEQRGIASEQLELTGGARVLGRSVDRHGEPVIRLLSGELDGAPLARRLFGLKLFLGDPDGVVYERRLPAGEPLLVH